MFSEIPAISVIIVNWNGEDLLPRCLSALERQTFKDFEVLVVDNASTDGSLDVINQQFGWVRLVVLEKNYGFCGGNNRGIVEARGRYIVLLNNDTEVAPGFLRALFDAIEQNPEAGFCACRMLNFYERSRIDNCGIGLLAVGKGYQIGSGKINGSAFDHSAFVFGASGGAVLYRRTMLDQIGLLDEDYFSHTEDTDLSWRAQLAGYSCVYVPDAIVYHMGAMSVLRKGPPLYLIQRNVTWTYLKNMPTLLLFLTLPLHFLYTVYWLLRTMGEGEAMTVLRAKIDALKELPSILKKRHVIQSERQISGYSLMRKMNIFRK